MTKNCPRCSRPMAQHRLLDLWRCTNVNCGLFDRPQYEKRAARVITERAEHSAALPPAPHPSVEEFDK